MIGSTVEWAGGGASGGGGGGGERGGREMSAKSFEPGIQPRIDVVIFTMLHQSRLHSLRPSLVVDVSLKLG